MSRLESDREDLIRDAVAMPERGEFRVPGLVELAIIGFRATAAMSVFIGQNEVYQFDPEGGLRRAFVEGCLYRSQHVTLARLQRFRTPETTQLQRSDLSADELSAFRELMHSRLSLISEAIRSDTMQTVRTVPAGANLRPKIVTAINRVLQAEAWLSCDIRARK